MKLPLNDEALKQFIDSFGEKKIQCIINNLLYLSYMGISLSHLYFHLHLARENTYTGS